MYTFSTFFCSEADVKVSRVNVLLSPGAPGRLNDLEPPGNTSISLICCRSRDVSRGAWYAWRIGTPAVKLSATQGMTLRVLEAAELESAEDVTKIPPAQSHPLQPPRSVVVVSVSRNQGAR